MRAGRPKARSKAPLRLTSVQFSASERTTVPREGSTRPDTPMPTAFRRAASGSSEGGICPYSARAARASSSGVAVPSGSGALEVKQARLSKLSRHIRIL